MREPEQPVTTDRVLTIPNVISLGRLLCVPLFLWLLFGRDNRAAAAGLLGALGATDWVDGYVARHFGQVSPLGKLLDPTADRILLLTAAVAILVDGSAPTWFVVIALAREAVVGLAALVLGAMGARRIEVTWAGKAGTFGMMFALPFFMASESTVGWRDLAEVLAWIAAIPGLIFSLYSAAGYVPQARRALAEGRARVGSTR